jgi:class 3 adenylate cyclase
MDQKTLTAIEKLRSFSAFAMIVDINSFSKIVAIGEAEGTTLAQDIRDILSSGIEQVEDEGGLVVGFMGDAFLAFLPDSESVFKSCAGIANELDKTCEYIASHKENFPHLAYGPKLKIGIEYGSIDVSTIDCEFLGTQKIFVGSTINYAARITSAGTGNRCLFGPQALKQGLNQWPFEGPFYVKGKKGEAKYEYYNLDLDDIWRNDPTDTSWR